MNRQAIEKNGNHYLIAIELEHSLVKSKLFDAGTANGEGDNNRGNNGSESFFNNGDFDSGDDFAFNDLMQAAALTPAVLIQEVLTPAVLI